MSKSLDEKAEEYADKTELDPDTYRGDVVTAYVCGAMDSKKEKIGKCPISAEEMLKRIKQTPNDYE